MAVKFSKCYAMRSPNPSSVCIHMFSLWRSLHASNKKAKSRSLMEEEINNRTIRRRNTLQDLLGLDANNSGISMAEDNNSGISMAEDDKDVYNRSFYVKLPHQFAHIAGGAVGMVMYSLDPVAHFQESIREMIGDDGYYYSQNPKALDELASCYVALNAPEYHTFIMRAFALVLTELGLEFSNVAGIDLSEHLS